MSMPATEWFPLREPGLAAVVALVVAALADAVAALVAAGASATLFST